jgi:hypothetical protein
MSYEEKKRLLYEKLAQGFPRDKPKVDFVTVPINPTDAEVIRRRPESLRLHAQRDDGVTVLMRPLQRDHVKILVDRVAEVDAYGRPIWPKAGAEHEYNPLDRL